MSSYFYHLAASLGLTGITTFILGLFVLWRKRAQQQGAIFFLWCLSISWWSLLELVIITREEQPDALFWGRVMQAGDIFLPTLFVHFVIAFLDVPVARWKLTTLYGISSLFAAFCFSPLVIAGASPRVSVPYFIDPGPLYIPMVVFFGVCVLYGQSKVFQHYQSASGYNRTRLGYFFWSSVAGYIGGCMNFLLVFQIEVPVLYSYGTYAVPVFVAATSYAIIRYRLMDITVVINKGLAYGLLLSLALIPTYLVVIISHRATLHSLPPFMAGTLVFACGLWVVLKNPRSGTNISFGLICLTLCAWLFGFFMLYSSTGDDEALFWEQVAYGGIVYIPALFYHFCASFLQEKSRSRLVLTNYSISTIFLFLIPTSYMLDGHYDYFWGHYPKAGVLHPLFLVYFATLGGLSLRKLYVAYKAQAASAPLDATRMKHGFWAFVIGYVASIDFVQGYGLEVYPVGFAFVTLWAITVTHAVLKYQFLDTSAVTPKPTALPYVHMLALIPFYLVVLLLLRIFTGTMQYVLAGTLVALFSIFAGLLVNLQKRMEKVVEKALFTKRYDAYETLTEFSKAMVTILDLKTLNQEILMTLAKVMGIEKLSLFLLNKEKDSYALKAAYGLEKDDQRLLQLRDPFPTYLRETFQPILREELAHEPPNASDRSKKAVVEFMAEIDSELSIPLINKDRLIGFLNLGHKSSREMYSQEDLNLLSTLAQNAAIALDNAVLYEDLKRSQILMRRTDRLRSLETIAGGFAHEIRNPLTSIKTFVQLAPERKDDGEFIDTFSKVVSEDVERIERLIQEILDYARYMEPKFQEEDLNDIVSSCLYFIEVKADSKSVRVEKALGEDLPRVLLDRQQIKQVLLNLFLNAMDAMVETGGRLTVKTHRLTKPSGEVWVQVEVKDTGCGISPANLEHIFDPFYSTKHESGEREGTGLGLSIVHQIVQEHRGYIEVDSAVGSGTAFFVNLPVNPVLVGPSKE